MGTCGKGGEHAVVNMDGWTVGTIYAAIVKNIKLLQQMFLVVRVG